MVSGCYGLYLWSLHPVFATEFMEILKPLSDAVIILLRNFPVLQVLEHERLDMPIL